MSSSHLMIVARHDDGRLELPLEDLTLYGVDWKAEEELLKNVAAMYDENWTLAIYSPMSQFYSGSMK